jgi:hypothetical protein
VAELDKLRAQINTSARMMAELQATNAQLRGAVSAHRSSSQSGTGSDGSSRGGGGASTGSQLTALETLLERRDKEISDLRQALAGSGAQLQRLALQGERFESQIIAWSFDRIQVLSYIFFSLPPRPNYVHDILIFDGKGNYPTIDRIFPLSPQARQQIRSAPSRSS